MRADIARHKPPAGPFDVKLVEGGLVDLEFCVHFVQLRDRVALDPRLWEALAAQRDAGLIAPEMVEAHDFMTRLLVTMRLVSPQSDDVASPSKELIARACGRPDWPSLIKDYKRMRGAVAEEWRRLVAVEPAEGEQR